MRDGDVFRKTEAGREEIRDRGRRLPPALRTVLLMVDGQRPVSELKEVIAGLREGGEVTISPLYLECGYSLIRRLLLSGRTFGGMLRMQMSFTSRPMIWAARS